MTRRRTAIRAADGSLNDGRSEVVFIDTSIEDWQTLADGVKSGMEVVLLDGSSDGLAQMAAWAEGKSGYDAIHILSHGTEGQVRLGTLTLDTATTGARTTDLAAIGAALTAEGDLLFYGCSVASGTGEVFIGEIARLTEADVAASTDLTGSSSLKGNWILESKVNVQDDGSILTEKAIDIWDGLLVAAVKPADATDWTGTATTYQTASLGFTAPLVQTQADLGGSGWDVINTATNNGAAAQLRLITNATGATGSTSLLMTGRGGSVEFRTNLSGHTFDFSQLVLSASGVGYLQVYALDSNFNVTGTVVEVQKTNSANTAYVTISVGSNTSFNDIYGIRLTARDFTDNGTPTPGTTANGDANPSYRVDSLSVTDVKAPAGDSTAPTFDVAPATTSVTTTGFTATSSLNESGTVYYVVVADNATAPSAAEVVAGTASGGGGALASGSGSAGSGAFDSSSAITGLKSGTAYDLYMVGKDTAGNTMATATKVDVTTSAATVTLSASPTTIAEAAGTSTITATLSAAASVDTVVTLTPTGTATGSGTDYTLSSTTITITAGQLTGTATVTAVQDTLNENNETVILDITNVTGGGGATESGTQQSTVTITDDDAAPTVSIANASLTEGNSGTSNMTFTVTLSAASGKNVMVDYATTNGTATAGVDYTTVSSFLTFTPARRPRPSTSPSRATRRSDRMRPSP